MRDRDELASVIADSLNSAADDTVAYFLDGESTPTDVSD
jgi:hypothetical protein